MGRCDASQTKRRALASDPSLRGLDAVQKTRPAIPGRGRVWRASVQPLFSMRVQRVRREAELSVCSVPVSPRAVA